MPRAPGSGAHGDLNAHIIDLARFVTGDEITEVAGALEQRFIPRVTMLGFGVIVNIAMTSGLAPIVGIPLPLMSYGGSAMVVNLTALGLLLNVKRRRLSLL